MKRTILTIVLSIATMTMALADSWQRLDGQKAATVVAAINSVQRKVKTVDAQFRQTRESMMLKQAMTSEGVLAYKAESNYVKWEYMKPYYSRFEMVNGKVSVSQSKISKRSSMPGARMFQGLAQFIINSFNGKGLSDTKNFTVDVYQLGTKHAIYLTPKKASMKRAFRQMRLYINEKTQMVNKIQLTGADGEITLIEFFNMKTS